MKTKKKISKLTNQCLRNNELILLKGGADTTFTTDLTVVINDTSSIEGHDYFQKKHIAQPKYADFEMTL